MSLLTVDRLSVRYSGVETEAVKQASFKLESGKSLAVVGESGSGKTTLALALGGLLDSGAALSAERLSLSGEDLLLVSKRRWQQLRRSEVAFVFQSPVDSWNPTRSLKAQALDTLKMAGRAEDYERLLDLLQRVGIDDPGNRLEDYPHQLSGGMLQRVSIAAALVHEPTLLIADEPTSALDSTVQAEILAILDELRSEANLTLVVISHDLSVVSRLADEVIVMYGGRIVEKARTENLLASSVHPYTRGLLASVPDMGSEIRRPLPSMRFGELARTGCVFAPRCGVSIPSCRDIEPELQDYGSGHAACGPSVQQRKEGAG